MEEKCEKILKAIEDLNIFIGNQNWEHGGKVWGNIEGDLEDETGFHKTLLLSPDWVSLCPSVDVWKRCTFCSKSSSTSTFGTVTARHVRVIFPPSDILATLIYVGPMMRYISTPPKSWSNIMFTMRCHCKSRSTCSHLCKIARIVKYLWIYASLALLVVKDQNYSVENILPRETHYKLVNWGQTFLTQSLAGLSHQSELCKFFVKNEGIHNVYYTYQYLRPNLLGQPVCVKIGLCRCGRLRYVICNLLAAESSASVDSHIVWTPVLMPRGQAKNEAAVEFKWKCLSGMTIWTVLDVGRCPDMQNLPTGIQSRIQVNANPHFCLIGSTVAMGL